MTIRNTFKGLSYLPSAASLYAMMMCEDVVCEAVVSEASEVGLFFSWRSQGISGDEGCCDDAFILTNTATTRDYRGTRCMASRH
jgi:hypothetical protein